ncbi:MAG: DedA family protein [Qingshengfaniella sp.]
MTDFAISLMESNGYTAVFLLMVLENVFPPIPSEIIMPLAGYGAQRGDLNLILVILAGSAGSFAGALFWYLLGRGLGAARLRRLAAGYGRWLTLTPGDIDGAQHWFDRHGGKAVFAGHLVPAVRTLISVPAGITGMGPGRFSLYTLAGTVLWTGALAGAGWILGTGYDRIATWINPVSNLVLAGLVAIYLYRVITYRPEGAADKNSPR